jgi:hypothetical protein
MKKTRKIIALCTGLAVIAILAFSCDGGLDVQQVYGFDLETMPVQNEILPNETAEIRCTIVREGEYAGTRYALRYFQPDGKGELRLDDGTLFAPNDLYPLDRTVFRLYYTSRGSDAQTIDVYIEDSFGQEVQKSFSWQNENADDDSEEDAD